MGKVLIFIALLLMPVILYAERIDLKSSKDIEGTLSGSRNQKVFDKMDFKALSLQNAEIPREVVLREVREKAVQNKNFSFDFKYESFAGDSRHDIGEGSVFVKNEGVWHEETQSNHEGMEIRLNRDRHLLF